MTEPRHYPTPPQVTLQALAQVQLGRPDRLRILEPCAGQGAIVRTLLAWGADASRVTAVEIDEQWEADLLATGCRGVTGCCLEWAAAQADAAPYDLALTNPPFELAAEMVGPMLARLRPGGELWLLNRSAWLHSGKRLALHRRFPPSDVYLLPCRPSYVESGRTDLWDYAWTKWVAGRVGETRLHWLDDWRTVALPAALTEQAAPPLERA